MINDKIENINDNNQKIFKFFQDKKDKKNLSIKSKINKCETDRNFAYDLQPNRHSNSIDERRNNSKLDSMDLIREKMKNFQLKNKKEFSSSDMLTSSLEYNDKTTDSHQFFSSLKIKSKRNNSKGSNKMLNKIIGLDKKLKKKKAQKKVTFDTNFVNYINIESYKKYYIENNGLDAKDKTETKCTCLIY